MRSVARLLVTALAPVALYFGGYLTLSGINVVELRNLVPGGGPLTTVSVFALGITPAISAFVLVELAALLVPRWRKLRVGTPEERGRLAAPTVLVAVLVAAVQGWFIFVWIRGLGRGVGGIVVLDEYAFAPGLVIPLTLVGGALLLMLFADLLGRFGLVNGYSAILVADAALRVARLRPAGPAPEGEQLLSFVVAAATVVFATVWVLRSRARAGNVLLRLPASGLVRFIDTAAIPGWFSVLIPITIIPSALPAQIPVVVGLCGFYTWLFSRPSLLRDVVPNASSGFPRRAALLSALYLAVLVLIDRRLIVAGIAVNVTSLAVVTAVVMDIIAEGRARLGRDLVSIWPIHRVQVADLALAALREAGIEAHLRGVNHRTLLFFFGPYVPIEVMVSRPRQAEARAALERLFHPAPVEVFE